MNILDNKKYLYFFVILFSTGYDENVIAHHGVLGQEINFISKPIIPVALIQKIKDILNDNLQH